ncbi:MAG: AraC family transcriptional regulator [Lachnospiraceae bacterium]
MQQSGEYKERASYSWSEDSIRLMATPPASVRNTFFYVQEVGAFHTEPPYFTERANLYSFLIVYTLKGSGALTFQGTTYPLSQQQAFYINCQIPHYYECTSAEGWDILWVHFNGSSALGYYEEFAQRGSPVCTMPAPDFMEDTLRRILELTQKKDKHSEIICSSLLVSLLTELLLQDGSGGLLHHPVPAYVKDAARYIDAHFTEPLTIELLAEHANISKYHLIREFKKHMGASPLEFAIMHRIHYAKELLRYSEQTVSEIAYANGVTNVSHFIRLFKKHEGVTPHVYRKLWTS